MLMEMAERLRGLDERIRQYNQRVARVFDQDKRCHRLVEVEGRGTADRDRTGGGCGQRT